ncbi:heparan-alpha-glucosaminide N-acetyltransferase domain-containing protein [Brevibacterium album]|uniref:heparan-alpha-glucosaminide N-acetyltransferase domain-containing protein n=1 Tax=Brevibacterium album TaxID=417948 RepID=UPI0003FF31FC|nr:heparan-alpha-glucosaminide N-acetyltransferase domain-containing protein [Brevibacterium album]
MHKTHGRILGLDLARGIALFGMIATHVLPRMDAAGELTFVAQFQGRASALFAVLAGVSIVLSTRRTLEVPGLRGWAAAAAGLTVRGLFIGLLGLALGELPSGIAVILVNYGALFVIAALFLRLPAWALGPGAALWFLLTPQLSHVLRSDPAFADMPLHVPAFSLVGDPDMWVGLVLTAYYPLLQWTGYILLGMWLARTDWSAVSRRVLLVVMGLAVSVLAASISSLLMTFRGMEVLESLYATGIMADGHSYVERLIMLGAYGVTPADSAWWLATSGPHSGTTFDLVHTSGIALAVIGLCLLAGPWLERHAWLHAWLSRPGSMPLSMYTLHIVIVSTIAATAGEGDVDIAAWTSFAVNIAALIVVSLVWSSLVSRRGPLESLSSFAVRGVTEAVLGPTGRTRTGTATAGWG